MKSHPNAGQFKLKGRKEKLLSCKCCVVLNLREQEYDKESSKEVKEYTYEPDKPIATDPEQYTNGRE